ncbi:3-ketoacyl-CoA reductase [Dichomitus squalens LYAD-421 SS1]|uniref:Very-long-chain 3-oxoacyl-CoA reductase n=1 Tax=Dichomitus squalens (strain LYAD-421) TaxID=732165 RepID=R7SWC9_DICSQ|nr:3-ketoacyl-CoA reductase [Dichomitus squalens LYAD-421 SS1]EJF60386.1 3-ketoacyl-CoA reductase [Dichomitus squalens LYAD-421 SS1]
MATIFSIVQFPSSHVLVTDYPKLTLLLFAIGGFTAARFALKTLFVLLQTFVVSGKSLKKYGAGKGAWAVVTGASEGIGREFALQLAQQGFNVVVSARNASALATLVSEIEAKSTGGKKVQAKAVPMDFSKLDDAAQWGRLESELAGLDIGVLVNNAGKSYNYPEEFHASSRKDMEDIVTINVNSVIRLTHIVLPGMVERKRGLIINMGSFSGTSVASPMLSTYAGTKSFLSSFSGSLAEEVRGKGIDVECVNTYFVVSNMSKIRRSSALIPTPKAFVRSVLSKITLPGGALWTNRPGVVTPYWSHGLLDYVMNVIGWNMAFVRYTHSLHKDIRRRALRKLEREAKQQ